MRNCIQMYCCYTIFILTNKNGQFTVRTKYVIFEFAHLSLLRSCHGMHRLMRRAIIHDITQLLQKQNIINFTEEYLKC